MKYRQPGGKENKLHIGAFPAVSLAGAREKRDSAKQLLATGMDPTRASAEQARLARLAGQNTFEHVARDWHKTMINKWQPRTARENYQFGSTWASRTPEYLSLWIERDRCRCLGGD